MDASVDVLHAPNFEVNSIRLSFADLVLIHYLQIKYNKFFNTFIINGFQISTAFDTMDPEMMCDNLWF